MPSAGRQTKSGSMDIIKPRVFLLLGFLSVFSTFLSVVTPINQIEDHGHGLNETKEPSVNVSKRYSVLTINFKSVQVPCVICLWVLLASVAKIGFHKHDKLPHIFPESCLLITLGILVGLTLKFTETASSQQYSLDANIFFLFLLPPIIYDAGYHMPNRAFFNNMGTILLLAVINTLWNTFGIGLSLWGVSASGWLDSRMNIFSCLSFGALISAVDSVTVLAIFEEIQMNELLYILVFGESLLNDGVILVLYRMMDGYASIGVDNILPIDLVAGVAQFFVVVIGGTLVGAVYAFLGALVTKFTDHVRILEPLIVFLLGYLAYLTAETLGLSSILALAFGGIIMRHYTEANMANKSTTTVKYFMKMLATISETIIFMFLGLSTVIDSHDFQLDFTLFSILFCLVFRVIGIVVLTALVNRHRLVRLSVIDQLIMSYGGLRGGTAFCLALLLNTAYIPERSMYLTTTTVIIFFNVFIQGTTIKPMVNALKIDRAKEKQASMNEMIHKRFMDHLMAGVEDIIGKSGHNSFQHKFDYYNTKYLKPLLLREQPKSRNACIVSKFKKLSVMDAKAAIMSPVRLARHLSLSNLVQSNPAHRYMSRRATIAVVSPPSPQALIQPTSSAPELASDVHHSLSQPEDVHHSLSQQAAWLQPPQSCQTWSNGEIPENHRLEGLTNYKRVSLTVSDLHDNEIAASNNRHSNFNGNKDLNRTSSYPHRSAKMPKGSQTGTGETSMSGPDSNQRVDSRTDSAAIINTRHQILPSADVTEKRQTTPTSLPYPTLLLHVPASLEPTSESNFGRSNKGFYLGEDTHDFHLGEDNTEAALSPQQNKASSTLHLADRGQTISRSSFASHSSSEEGSTRSHF